MTDLLKKTKTWNWTPQCQVAFNNLKRAMETDPVLALPDMSKPFTVEIDASDFALGGVLMLDNHPVAFESRKLKDIERRYSVHEKELLAVVYCLRLRWHYLLCSPFMVKTDNTAYRTGSSNHVADALSHRADLATLGSVTALSSSAVATPVRDRARELLPKDLAAQGQVHLVEQGKARQFWLEDGLLMTKGNRLYVPKGGDLRKSLISECHDTLWAGQPGEERTYALVQRAYYWPQMRDDVETYVRTCLICQQDKTDHQKKAGSLQPLPIPKRPWVSVSMDYISGLPKVGDLGSIIVVVDRLSKYATFIAAPKHVMAEGMTHLFFKHVVKYWGLPKDIVSDRDSCFTGIFWIELVELLGSKLSMSPSYHPQSDGQTERFNVGRIPSTLCARSCLEKAQKRMKKYADNNRRFIEFNAGDLVMVKVPNPRLSKSPRGRDPRLMQKYIDPLPIIKRIGTKGCNNEENTWERVTNVKAFLPLVEAYHASHAPRTSPSQVGENVKSRPHSRHPCHTFGHATAQLGRPTTFADRRWTSAVLEFQALVFRIVHILINEIHISNPLRNLLLSYYTLLKSVAAVAYCVAIPVGTLVSAGIRLLSCC
ncbi:Transposon Ty3-G Gag-Pol polyprotein [Sesamum angolense]|uniref:Transposon Ty3-G Gag-Pol polyprotein n=1 Tax=Sesamum angolense TaxID=2727404 RepID=A0AAE2BJ47_9LAMI|nr:Transposon Ty3-G Gag-Pol polyprotein [Sesamum angolense]